MKLDSKIIDGKKPLDCFDAENETVKLFIGEKGYFSYTLAAYENLNYVRKGTLDNIEAQKERCFWNKEENRDFHFFLPAEWVKEEKEKKYRPFSLEEFLKIFDIGDQIDFKGKGYCDEVKVAMFTGYITDVDRSNDEEPGAVELMLGCFHYSLLDLFKDYELFLDDDWQPFGVVDE